MPENVAALPVTVEVIVNCQFWPEGDLWKGVADKLGVTISGRSFKDAKEVMQDTLKAYLEELITKELDSQLPTAA